MQTEGPDRQVRNALLDIVQPKDYVKWEYLSRQWLLASACLALRGPAGLRVLDVGCGHGALSLSLSEGPTFDVVAMDLLPSRIDSVRGKKTARPVAAAKRVRLLIADGQRLPFRPGTFDAITATEVLEHLDEPTRLFQEVARVLRQGGRFLMTTPNAEALTYRLLRFLPATMVKKLAASCTQESLHPELLDDHGPHPGTNPDQHRREGFTLSELRELGAREGLRLVHGYTYRIPLPDRVMSITPRHLSETVARLGTRPLPLGLQLFAEFERR